MLASRASAWRWAVYGLVGLATLIGGLIPLLPTVLVFLAMLMAQSLVIRRPMRWLGTARRATARFNLALALALLNAINLTVNVVILPFVGVSAFVAALVGTLLTVLYVEVGLRFVRGRLAAEAREEPLKLWEWALPGTLVATLVLCSVGSLGSLAVVSHLLINSDVVWAADIARFLVGA